MVEDLIKLREKLESEKSVIIDDGKKYVALRFPIVLGTESEDNILRLDYPNKLNWYYNRVEDSNVIEECEEEFKMLVNI